MLLDLSMLPVIRARHFRALAPGRRVDWVVLHTAEVPETATSAEAVARYFATTERIASAHFCVDSDSIVQCVSLDDVAFAAPGANANGVQIEMSGRANQGRAGWADAYSTAMLARTADLVAALCDRYDLPVVAIEPSGLRQGLRGITTHHAVTLAFRRSTHADPGPNFPMADFLEAVRRRLAGAAEAEVYGGST